MVARGAERLFEGDVCLPETRLSETPADEHAHGGVHRVERLFGEVRAAFEVAEADEREDLGRAPAPEDAGRRALELAPERAGGLEEGAAFVLGDGGGVGRGHARAVDGLGGEGAVKEREGGGEGVRRRLPVGAPPGLKRLEGVDDGRGARGGGGLSGPLGVGLKGFAHAPVGVGEEDVRARAEEHHLKAQAAVEVEVDDAVALGRAQARHAAVEGLLEECGDVPPGLAVAFGAKEEAHRSARRHAKHPRPLRLGEGQRQLVARLRERIAHHAPDEVRRPLAHERLQRVIVRDHARSDGKGRFGSGDGTVQRPRAETFHRPPFFAWPTV